MCTDGSDATTGMPGPVEIDCAAGHFEIFAPRRAAAARAGRSATAAAAASRIRRAPSAAATAAGRSGSARAAAVGSGDGSESMPHVAKITAPARGSAAHARGSWVAAHQTSRQVQPIRPISSTSQPSWAATMLGQIRGSSDGQPAGRAVVGQRVAEDEQRRPGRGSEDIVGDLCRGVPHVEPPPDVRVRGVGVANARTAAPSWRCPCRRAPASCRPAARAAPRSARRSARRARPARRAGPGSSTPHSV